MTRVPVIDPDREALAVLRRALGAAGFGNVAGVSSGSFALTMLERDPPHLIVSPACVPDIHGGSLCAILPNDPLPAGLRVPPGGPPPRAAPPRGARGRPPP